MKRFFLNITAMLFIALSFFVIPTIAYAADSAKQDACTAVGSLSGGGDNCGNTPGPSLTDLVRVVLQLLSIAAGIIAVIMIIVAGFNYITSEGDATKISHAKSTLIYAIVGIVVVVFAQVIVRYVLKKAS